MNGLVRAAAVELAPIRVNAVSPGVILTNLWNSIVTHIMINGNGFQTIHLTVITYILIMMFHYVLAIKFEMSFTSDGNSESGIACPIPFFMIS
ncbi:SDR family oxidoreductase [Sphingobacterium sp. DR205]|uniref:SDR family oxidoreductase n=1 Tax=Sphingobacterium sp. DR205 TaxID=2713573 RepID=UPI003217AD2D